MADNWGASKGGWDDLEEADKQSNSQLGSGWGSGWENSGSVWGDQQQTTTNAPVQTQPQVSKVPVSTPAPIPKTHALPIPISVSKVPPAGNKEVVMANKSEAPCAIPVSKDSSLMVLSRLSEQQNISIDTLRMLVNHHAQDPNRNSFQDHVSEILFTPGQDIAFVNMSTPEAAQRVQNGLNGSKCFEKEVFSAISPSQIQFKTKGTVNGERAGEKERDGSGNFNKNNGSANKSEQQEQNSGWAPQPPQKVFHNNGFNPPNNNEGDAPQSKVNVISGSGERTGEGGRGFGNFNKNNVGDRQFSGDREEQRRFVGNLDAPPRGGFKGGRGTGRSDFNSGNRTDGNQRNQTFQQNNWGANKSEQREEGFQQNSGWAPQPPQKVFHNNGFRPPNNNEGDAPQSKVNVNSGSGERTGGGGRSVFGNFNKNNVGDRHFSGDREEQRRFVGKPLGNPDTAPRGGFRGGRGGGGGRSDFYSGNRTFVGNQRNQTPQQNNCNVNKSEHQEEDFQNSGWAPQPPQKIFHNNEFRPESDGDAPPSKVIVITGLDAEVKRQDLLDKLFSKTPQLIDYQLQRYNSGVYGQPPKAFLLIEFPNVEEATKAIEQLTDIDYMGMKLAPKFSRKPTINLHPSVVREHKHRNRYGEGDNHSVGNEATAISEHVSPSSTNSSPNAKAAAKKEKTDEGVVETNEEQPKEGVENKTEEKKDDDVEKVEKPKVDEKEGNNVVENGVNEEEEVKANQKEEQEQLQKMVTEVEEPKNGESGEEPSNKPEEEQLVEQQHGDESIGNTSSASTAEMMTTTSGDTEEKNMEESDEENKQKAKLVMSPVGVKKMGNGEANDEPTLEEPKEVVEEKNGDSGAGHSTDVEEAVYNSCSSGDGVEEGEKENKPIEMEDADEPPIY